MTIFASSESLAGGRPADYTGYTAPAGAGAMTMKRTALRITLPILLLAAGALLALYLLQDRMLFDRRTLSDEKLARLRADPAVEELWIPTPDGVTLHGWLVRGADAGGGHGNPRRGGAAGRGGPGPGAAAALLRRERRGGLLDGRPDLPPGRAGPCCW